MCGGSIDYKPGQSVYECEYCGCQQTFDVPVEKKKIESTISVLSDVEILLEKCKKDPRNARRYANLILDIDPFNTEATKYL